MSISRRCHIGQIRGIEDVERRHGRPGTRTMNPSIWSDMFCLTLPVVVEAVRPNAATSISASPATT